MTALATDSGRKTPARLAGSAILACQSDERLVELFRSGHERAFDAIVERYRKPLVRYCGRILPESRCEDAVQQALINAHAALLSSGDALRLKPWLYAITRNAALNMLRQNGWSHEQIPLEFDGVRRPDQVFEQRSDLQQTVAALNDLPARQRDALVMRELEGRSYEEIAVALGSGEGAVRQLLNRARVTLRGAMSMLMPPPLVARAAASTSPADGRRMSELLAGAGAAGVAKAGATALVAGTLVVGAVKAPLPLTDSQKPARQKAALTPPAPSADASRTAGASTTAGAIPVGRRASANGSRQAPARRRSTSGRSASTAVREDGRRGAGERERPRQETGERSDGGDDSLTRERTRSGDSPTSGSGGHSGPSGGSDDGQTTLSSGDDSTSPTSGTSGDATSGSGDSGSGSSGSDDLTTSGTSGSTEPGSSTSGLDDSLHSGSGSGASANTLVER